MPDQHTGSYGLAGYCRSLGHIRGLIVGVNYMMNPISALACIHQFEFRRQIPNLSFVATVTCRDGINSFSNWTLEAAWPCSSPITD
jgi:hypothetical protein